MAIDPDKISGAVGSRSDLRSASILIKASMASVEVKNGQVRIKNWPKESVISVEDISGG
jgi:hypothetical protein